MGVDLTALFAGLGGGARAAAGSLADISEKRQRQQQLDLQQQNLMGARAMQEAAARAAQENQQRDDALKGIRYGQAPDNTAITHAMDAGGAITGQFGLAGVQAMKAADPTVNAPDRFQQVTPSSYIDHTATPEAIHERSAAVAAMRQAEAQQRQFQQQAAMEEIRARAAEARQQAHDKSMVDRTAAATPKPTKYQVVQTDQGTLQVNPETGETRTITGPNGTPLQKPIPPQMAQAHIGNKQTISKIDQAIADLDAHPNAVGFLRGRFDALDQRLDPQGVNARAGVADVGSLLMHDRSGAAVTISEYPRLAPFVPSSHDSPQVARQKLLRLKAAAADNNLQIEQMFPGIAQAGAGPVNPWRR